MQQRAVAIAHPNIALVKYWGKRDVIENLPATPSLSITLDTFTTRTEVSFDHGYEQDHIELNGRTDDAAHERIVGWLKPLRDRANTSLAARIVSHNNFPTAAGLASSASGFAALAVATTRALGLSLTKAELSALARRGSGSAARSIYGGFVTLPADQGADSHAQPLLAAADWPLAVVIAITESSPKTISSRQGMRLSSKHSPYYPAWVDSADDDLTAASQAVQRRDFAALAEVSERSCLKMHGLMLASGSGLIYWNAATLACLHRVRQLRADGLGVFFTIDAGPQLKAVCLPEAAEQVRAALAEISGVQQVITTGLGAAARLEPES